MTPKPDQVDMAYHMAFLEDWAAQAAVVVEIGCGQGNGSTRALARGIALSKAPNRIFVTVDHNPDNPEEKPPLPYWHLVTGPSEESNTVARVMRLLGRRHADLLFIDTEHTYTQMKLELRAWEPIIGDHTIMLFHDIWMFGFYNKMTEAIKEYAKEHPGWEYQEVTRECHGMGMLRRTS